jgi:hypothetical protein
MTRNDTKTRLGVESLEARDCPSGLTTSFSWGAWSWGESGWDVRTAQTNPSNGQPSGIPVEQVSIAR